MKQGHLGTVEVTLCMTYLNPVLIFYSLPAVLFERAQTGAWLLTIGTGAAAIFMFIGFYLLLKRFPGKSIIDIAEELMGVPARLTLMVAIFSFYLYMLVMLATALAGNLINLILPTTPLSFLLGMLLLALMLVAYIGLEAFTRAVMILAPFMIFGFLLIVFLALHKADFTNLYPMPGVRMSQLAVHSVTLAPLVFDGLWLAQLPPYLRGGKSVLKIFAWAALFSTLMMTAVILAIETKFIYPMGERMIFPVFQMVRLIHIGDFIQRIESLYIIMFVIGSTIHIVLLFFGIITALGQGLRLTDWRPVLLPLGIIVFALGFLLPPANELAKWYYSPNSSFLNLSLQAGMPLVLLGIALLKGKKKGAGSNA